VAVSGYARLQLVGINRSATVHHRGEFGKDHVAASLLQRLSSPDDMSGDDKSTVPVVCKGLGDSDSGIVSILYIGAFEELVEDDEEVLPETKLLAPVRKMKLCS